MGNFEGHALPGSFFVVFAIWWVVKYSWQTIKNSTVVRGSSTKMRTSPRSPKLLHMPETWEGIVIVIMTIVGFIAEQSWPVKKWALISNVNGTDVFVYGAEWQHCTMYIFFGIYGASLLIARTCMPSLKRHELFFLGLAYAVEGLLFYFHVHGRDPLDVTCHMMLVIAISVCSLASLGMLWRPQDQLLPFLQAGFTLVQGTWFWQVAFVLYPLNHRQWDGHSHHNVMFVTVCFCWHVAMALFVSAMLYGSVSLILRSHGAYSAHPYLAVNGSTEEVEIGLIGKDNKARQDDSSSEDEE